MSDDNKSKKLSLKRNNKTGNGQSRPLRSYGGDDVEVKVREKRSFTKPNREDIERRKEQEAKAKAEAEALAQAEARKKAEEKAKAEAEAKAKSQAEEKARAEAKAKKAEFESRNKIIKEATRHNINEKKGEEFRKKAEAEAQARNIEATKRQEEEAKRLVEENAKRWEAEEAERAAHQNDYDEEFSSRYVKEAEEEQEREEENRGRRRNATQAKKGKSREEEERDERRRNQKGNKKLKGNAAKLNQQQHGFNKPVAPVARDVVIGETITVSDLAQKMAVKASEVIKVIMKLGDMVTINQVIDQETAQLVAEEMGHKVIIRKENELEEAVLNDRDMAAKAEPRAPVVTIMGHVDHGKTSLLDYIRKAKVASGEAGGITQHIGAYNVQLEDGRKITFLDTPGHEAFTAMRARGAQVTDIAIIIIAADDAVMPTTKEAIAHAQAANVPMVFAINKIDKPGANPDRVREELASMNLLVEEWGGKYQCQEISAKKGIGISDLMEKVLLEAEMLDLKANPNRKATGSIIESSLDKGRGYVSTVLVSNGTLRVGDNIIAGTSWGRIKAMFNERNQRIQSAGPAEPAIILGLNGAPTAGDSFHVLETEQEARDIANKRLQLQREQGLRTQKRLTLSDISHRIALGSFKELNIIVKGDTDGSIEALSDSFIKMSTEKIKVDVIYRAARPIM